MYIYIAEHSGTHATFLIPFFIVRMLYIDSNIPKLIFYSALVGEFLRIARSSLLYKDFHEKDMELLNRMKAQRAKSLRYRKTLSEIIRRHEKVFENFGTNCFEFLSERHIEIRKLNVNN